MNEKKYKYDVAFSFLDEDKSVAVSINNLLQEKLNTFIYLNKQKILVGNDGIEEFSKVFSEESRIVVIIYRENWGKTQWTRIEKTAIQGRSLKEGYNFTVFIPLDKPVNLPAWYPKGHIYLDIGYYGVKAAAGIIESKVQEAGGFSKIEDAESRASKLNKQLEFTRQ